MQPPHLRRSAITVYNDVKSVLAADSPLELTDHFAPIFLMVVILLRHVQRIQYLLDTSFLSITTAAADD